MGAVLEPHIYHRDPYKGRGQRPFDSLIPHPKPEQLSRRRLKPLQARQFFIRDRRVVSHANRFWQRMAYWATNFRSPPLPNILLSYHLQQIHFASYECLFYGIEKNKALISLLSAPIWSCAPDILRNFLFCKLRTFRL